MSKHQHLEAETEQHQATRQALSFQISDPQSPIHYNKKRLAEGDYEVLEALNVTDKSETSEVTVSGQ